MSSIVSIIQFMAGGYLVIMLLLFVFQGHLLYFPGAAGRDLSPTPAAIGLEYEDVTLRTVDGIDIHGWFLPADNARGALLFLHGNAGNISHRLDSLLIFHDLGLAVFIIDYRGYGRSKGKPSEQGTSLDAEAAWQYLVDERGISADDIVVFGRSLGAAVAAHLAAVRQPGALVVESGFTSVPDMAAAQYPFFPIRWLCRFQYNTERYLQLVSCPLLVIHSPDDEIVPFRFGRRIFEAAGQPKQFLEIRGNHNDGFLVSGSLYVDGLDSFLTGLPKKYSSRSAQSLR